MRLKLGPLGNERWDGDIKKKPQWRDGETHTETERRDGGLKSAVGQREMGLEGDQVQVKRVREAKNKRGRDEC